ncbi:MAG: 50S ribosomal protein L11 methyltransferase [Candidatus Muiribacteriaceae bacterium]
MKNKWKKIIIHTGDHNIELISSFLNDLGYESLLFEEEKIIVYTHTTERMDILKGKFPGIEYKVKETDDTWSSRLHGDFDVVEAGRFAIVSVDYADKYEGTLQKVLINPAQAFGSGQHATTRHCIQFIQDICDKERIDSFIEVGCGTAILSLIACKCGVRDVNAFDIDADAVVNAEENMLLNGCDFNIWTEDIEFSDKKYDLICVNIFAHIIMQNYQRISSYGTNGSFFVFSGIENSQADDIRTCMSAMRLIREKTTDGWTSFIYQKVQSD